MPKETILARNHGRTTETLLTKDGAVKQEVTHRPPMMQIGWHKEHGEVRVGVIDSDTESGGLWCELDRAGINRAIRSLRRARDQAFGADA